MRSSAIRDLLALTERREVLSLAGGMPPLGAVHDDVLATAAAEVLADVRSVQYGPTEGRPELRAWIAGAVDRAAGAAPAAAADDVLVTHGSQQALDLVVRALVEPGTPVVVERPTYLGAAQMAATQRLFLAWRRTSARTLGSSRRCLTPGPPGRNTQSKSIASMVPNTVSACMVTPQRPVT